MNANKLSNTSNNSKGILPKGIAKTEGLFKLLKKKTFTYSFMKVPSTHA